MMLGETNVSLTYATNEKTNVEVTRTLKPNTFHASTETVFKNLTKQTDKYKLTYNYNDDKFITTIIAVACMLVSIYVLTCIVYYKYNKDKKSFKRSLKSTTKYIVYMDRLSFTSSVLITSLLAMEIVESRFGDVPDLYFCDWIKGLRYTLYTLAILSTLLILWYRQRVFYEHSSVRHLTNSFLRILSRYTFHFLIFSAIFCLIIILATRRYTYSPRGCLKNSESIKNLPALLSTVSVGLYHGIFILLSSFPLIKQRRLSNLVSEEGQPLRKYTEIIHRCLLCMVYPTLTSVVMLVLAKFVVDDLHTLYKHLLYDVDLIILFVCVIGSYIDLWKLLTFKDMNQNCRMSSRSTNHHVNVSTEQSPEQITNEAPMSPLKTF